MSAPIVVFVGIGDGFGSRRGRRNCLVCKSREHVPSGMSRVESSRVESSRVNSPLGIPGRRPVHLDFHDVELRSYVARLKKGSNGRTLIYAESWQLPGHLGAALQINCEACVFCFCVSCPLWLRGTVNTPSLSMC